MKNSIRAMFAMLAILPCALFFTACGGEKITTEEAQAAMVAALTETGAVTTDYKIELNAKISGEFTEGVNTDINLKASLKKAGEATTSTTDDSVNVDNVKFGIDYEATMKASGQKATQEGAMVIGKVGDNFVMADTTNKLYSNVSSEMQAFFAMDIQTTLASLIEMAGSMGDIDLSGLEGMITDESETITLTAEKTGDKDFKLVFKGYQIIAESGLMLDGKITLTIKDGKFSKLTVDGAAYVFSATDADETAMADKANYTEKVADAEVTLKMTYGKQTVTMPTSLDGYTEGLGEIA